MRAMQQPLLPFCALLCFAFNSAGQPARTTSPATKPNGTSTSPGGQPSKAATGQKPTAQPPQPTDPKASGQNGGAAGTVAPPAGAATTPDLTDPLAKTPCGADTPDEVPAGAGKPYVIGPLDVLQ